MVPDLFSMEILEKQLFQGMFCFFVSVLYFGSWCSPLVLFSCLFNVGFRFLCVSPFGIQFVSIFLLWNSCFHFLSLYFPWSLDHARLSPWAQGPADVFTLRSWLTIRNFDMKQMKTVLKMITEDEKTTSQSK